MAGAVIGFAVIGVVLAALGIPLMQRRIKPNGWYGVRVAATFADESVWYDANASSGRDFLVFGVLQVAVALLLPLWLSDSVYVATNTALLLAGALIIAFVGIRRANRMLRERRA
jgi:uncharacterized membrane protein